MIICIPIKQSAIHIPNVPIAMRPKYRHNFVNLILLACSLQTFDELLDVVVVIVGRIHFIYFLLGGRQIIVLIGYSFPLGVSFNLFEAVINFIDFLLCANFFLEIIVVILNYLLDDVDLVANFLADCVEEVLEGIDYKVHAWEIIVCMYFNY